LYLCGWKHLLLVLFSIDGISSMTGTVLLGGGKARNEREGWIYGLGEERVDGGERVFGPGMFGFYLPYYLLTSSTTNSNFVSYNICAFEHSRCVFVKSGCFCSWILQSGQLD